MARRLNIIWLSANLFGYELLKQALELKNVNISAIITLSSEALTKMYDGIDKERWYEFGIPVYEVRNINDEIRLLEKQNPGFVVMAGWRQIINKEIIELPSRGFIGFHPTLLPKGRGPAPIINTILTGLNKSGVTMFYVNDGVDNGDIIGQVSFKVEENDYAMDIYNKIIRAGKELIKKFLPLLIEDKASRTKQDNKKVTYFPARRIKDNEINLVKDSPEKIYRKIRALAKPYNGAYIKLKNKKLIIWQAELR